MLKFLEGREGEGKLRITIRKRPEIAFGVSLEAPATFQSQFSMISPSSYVNPYVEMERRRLEQVAPGKVGSLSPPWTHKTNISLVEVRVA
jgi:2-keto-4-pentenoate hydratase